MTSRASKRSTEPRSSELLTQLHPALLNWFNQNYPELSEIQRLALPHTLAGENTLILAPTGSGKTLAAFLSVLSNLANRATSGKLKNAVCAVYVSPLKALANDIQRHRRCRSQSSKQAAPSPDTDYTRNTQFHPFAKRLARGRLRS
jgi:Lhr-like helicase